MSSTNSDSKVEHKKTIDKNEMEKLARKNQCKFETYVQNF